MGLVRIVGAACIAALVGCGSGGSTGSNGGFISFNDAPPTGNSYRFARMMGGQGHQFSMNAARDCVLAGRSNCDQYFSKARTNAGSDNEVFAATRAWIDYTISKGDLVETLDLARQLHRDLPGNSLSRQVYERYPVPEYQGGLSFVEWVQLGLVGATVYGKAVQKVCGSNGCPVPNAAPSSLSVQDTQAPRPVASTPSGKVFQCTVYCGRSNAEIYTSVTAQSASRAEWQLKDRGLNRMCTRSGYSGVGGGLLGDGVRCQ